MKISFVIFLLVCCQKMNVTRTERSNFKCFKCSKIVKGPVRCLFKHFRHNHNMKTGISVRGNFLLVCDQNGCDSSFHDFGTFRKHLLKCTVFSSPVELNNDRTAVPSIDGHVNDNYECDNHVMVGSPVTAESRKEFFGKLMLRLRVHHNVSNTALDHLSKELRVWLLSDEGVTMQDSVDAHVSALGKLNSQQKRVNYYKEKFNLIEPEELFVNLTLTTRLGNGGIICRPRKNTFQYMSMRKRFSALFSNHGFRRLFYSETRSQDGFVRSTADSMFVKTHPLFSNVPHSIRIQLFYDEVE